MYRDGYGVYVSVIWEDDDRIADIDVYVVPLQPWAEVIVGGAICAEADSLYIPMDLFEQVEDLATDDTHDLRARWFASRSEAEEYASYVERRWRNPSPWESFVQL